MLNTLFFVDVVQRSVNQKCSRRNFMENSGFFRISGILTEQLSKRVCSEVK